MHTPQSSESSADTARQADQLYAPTGKRIVASKDWIPGNALIQSASRLPDGSLEIEWAGETKLCWDGQYTEHDGERRIFLDEDANEWAEHRLVLGSEKPMDGHDSTATAASSPASDSATTAGADGSRNHDVTTDRHTLAERALHAAYGEFDGPEDRVTDLLSDLRHFCDRLGMDFAQLDRVAYRRYADEKVPMLGASPHATTANLDGEQPSARERLLQLWRLHPEAEVDLCSEEDANGGIVRLTDKSGDDIDEFRFASAEDADRAVDYALKEMQSQSGQHLRNG